MPVEPEQIRTLSIRQPWAELILRGDKTVEYRSQATKIRGKVYIYASPAKPEPDDEQFDSNLPRGMIVGTVEIADCGESDGDFDWIFSSPQRLADRMGMPSNWDQHPVWK